MTLRIFLGFIAFSALLPPVITVISASFNQYKGNAAAVFKRYQTTGRPQQSLVPKGQQFARRSGSRNQQYIAQVAHVLPLVPMPFVAIQAQTGHAEDSRRHKSLESQEITSDEVALTSSEEKEVDSALDSKSDEDTTSTRKTTTTKTTTERASSTTTAKKTTEQTSTKPATDSYKVIYFDARGICESIRLLFIYANVTFIDKRISKKEWLRMKDRKFPQTGIKIIKGTEFGKIPILEVNGKRLSQCSAISRYLAHKFELDGESDWERAKLDEINEFHREVVHDMSPYLYVLGGYRNGNQEQIRKEVFVPAVEKHFPVYSRLLRHSKSGFFGRKVTWVDFAVSEFLYTIKRYEPAMLKKFPVLARFLHKVYHLPEIRPYLKKRSRTPLLS